MFISDILNIYANISLFIDFAGDVTAR